MIPIAFVENRTSGVVKALSLDWGRLSERLSQCHIGDKDGSGWMPADIEPGQRTAERVKSVSALVFDCEAKAETVDGVKKVVGAEPPDLDTMLHEVDLSGWRCILHTSYNHTAEHSRYRLTFDLARPLAPEEVKPLGLYVAAILGIADCIDTGCLEPARLFYLPRCAPDRKDLFRHAETKGVALPVDELLAEAAQLDTAQKSAPRRTGQSGNVIEAFNNAHDVGAILEKQGYAKHGKGRWLWHGSTTGLAGVRLLPDAVPQRVFSSHGGDPLNDGHAHDAFDLWRILKHSGDMSAAVKDAAQICGMEKRADWRSPDGASTSKTASIDTSQFVDTVELIDGASVKPEAVRWLWNGYLARGKLHVLAGAPGTGKTMIALALAATVSTGGRWPDGTRCEPGTVLIWSAEDDIADTLVPRLIAMGADMHKIKFVGDKSTMEGREPFDPARDMPMLMRTVADAGEIKLLIVDPIVSAVAGDSHKNAEVRRGLQPLVDVGQKLGAAVLGISHFSKGTAGREVTERVTGSLAFGALARVVLAAAKRSEEDGGGRILARAKSNIGPDGGGFAYDLAPGAVAERSDITVHVLQWGNPIEGSARDLLASAEDTGEPGERNAVEEAADWLGTLITEEGGQVDRRDVMKAANAMGIKERTLHRARQMLGLIAVQTGYGKDKRSVWKRGESSMCANSAHACQAQSLANMGRIGTNGVSGNVVEVDV